MNNKAVAFVGAPIIALVLGYTPRASASCAARQTTHFEISQTTEYGQSVFVSGDTPELGNNDVRHALKLEPSSYPIWKLDVSLPKVANIRYRYFIRSDKAEDISKSSNGTPVSETFTLAGSEKQINIVKHLTKPKSLGTSDSYKRDYELKSPPRVLSKILGESRAYRVILPPGYDANSKTRYPVLYAHDGQNFSEMGPFGSWNAIDALNAERAAGRLRDIIVVGIDNTSNRNSDYVLSEDGGRGELYIRFIEEELKPLIDSRYRTLSDAANTGALGSSLGGLISLAMLWDHSTVFGRAGVFSASFQLPNFTQRVSTSSRPGKTRIYLDSGESGPSLDNFYLARSVRDSLIAREDSYVTEEDFRYVVGLGQQHNESAWAQRLPGALSFLFPSCETGSLKFTSNR